MNYQDNLSIYLIIRQISFNIIHYHFQFFFISMTFDSICSPTNNFNISLNISQFIIYPVNCRGIIAWPITTIGPSYFDS